MLEMILEGRLLGVVDSRGSVDYFQRYPDANFRFDSHCNWILLHGFHRCGYIHFGCHLLGFHVPGQLALDRHCFPSADSPFHPKDQKQHQ